MEEMKTKVMLNLYEIYLLARIIETCGSNPELKKEIEGDLSSADMSIGRIIGQKARELLDELDK